MSTESLNSKIKQQKNSSTRARADRIYLCISVGVERVAWRTKGNGRSKVIFQAPPTLGKKQRERKKKIRKGKRFKEEGWQKLKQKVHIYAAVV